MLENLGLKDGVYKVETWKPSAPGGIIKNDSCQTVNGKVTIELPDFVDDLVVHIFNQRK